MASRERQPHRADHRADDREPAAAVEVISLSGIIDRPVYGSDEEELGTVVNVFADVISHRLLYALLEVGGFLGIGSRRILVPFPALGWTAERLILPVDRPTLEAAPDWDRSSVLDEGYQAEVLGYWERPGDGWRADQPVIGPGRRTDR